MEFSYVPLYLEGTTEYQGRSVKTEFVKEFKKPEYPKMWCCDPFYELWGSDIVLTRREVEKVGLNYRPIIAIKGTEDPDYSFHYCPFCGEEIMLTREESEV